MGAKRAVPVDAGGHFSAADPVPAVGMRISMLEELVAAGLRASLPFTLDPRGPLDYLTLRLSDEEREVFAADARDVPRYHELMTALGLRDERAYTCTPYLDEVGHHPARDQVVVWSESSCIIYVNSVIGARCNRTPAIVDLFANLLGEAPEFGLLTEAGRRATWLVEVTTSALPDPQLLGAAVARAVVGDVPYVTGLGELLEDDERWSAADYLKEMGAAAAAVGGAVGLMHVEGVTPEALDDGRGLLVSGAQRYVVDDHELEGLAASYAAAGSEPAPPERAVIGCPHLSVAELTWWEQSIAEQLARAGREQVAVQTILAAAPDVITAFLAAGSRGDHLAAMGVELTPACLEAFMDNPACAARPTVTTSNKLRAYTRARLVDVGEMLEIVGGSGRCC